MTLCASCMAIMTSHGESWQTIQSRGGLRVDNPIRQSEGSLFLPVICDVSGMQAITVQPKKLDSASVVRRIDVTIETGRIGIQIVTCLTDKRHQSMTKGVDLGIPPSGRYRVEYLNPDGSTVLVKEIEIK